MQIQHESTVKVANLIIPADFPAFNDAELTPIERQMLKARILDPLSSNKYLIIQHVAEARHIKHPSNHYWRVVLAWWHCADLILDVLLAAWDRKKKPQEWVLIPAITPADAEHYELYGAPRSVYATVYPTSKDRWAYDIEIERLYALTSQSVYATPQEAMAVAETLLAPHLRFASEEAQMKLNAVGLVNPADLQESPNFDSGFASAYLYVTQIETAKSQPYSWKKTKHGWKLVEHKSSKSKMAQPVAAAL
jgi:hypothetical protein